MKILICTGIYPPDIGGPATYSKLLFDELPKKGIEVEVLSFGEVRKYPKIFRHFLYFLKTLKRGKSVDLIYAQDPVSVGLPSIVASKILGKKFFIRIAGDYAWEQYRQKKVLPEFRISNFEFRKKVVSIEEFQDGKYDLITEIRKKTERWVAKKSDKIIVPSHYFKKIIEMWNIEEKTQSNNKKHQKIDVIYNGINLNFEKMAKKESNDEKILLSVGRLVPWKGFKELIEMIPDILKEVPQIKLHIVGDGPQRKELEDLIVKLGLQDKVILLGKISRDELLRQKQLSDIFVFNTNWESFSFDTIESMMVGLSVVTTNICSLPELIENNKEGILVEPNNKEQIKNAVVKILQDNDFRNTIIQNAQQKVQKFSIQNTLDELEKILKE